MSGKMAKLEDIKKGILISIKETKSAKTDLERYSAALFGAKMLKAGCDGIVAILAGYTGAGGRIVSGAYQAGTSLADAGTKAALGQNVDLAKTAIDMTAGAATIVVGKKGLQYDRLNQDGVTERLRKLAEEKSEKLATVSDLISAQRVKSKIVVDAVRSDEKSLWESFKEYSWEIGAMSASAAGKGLGKAFSGLKELVNFHKALKENMEELKENRDTRQFDGIIRTFESQLLAISAKISALQAEIAGCEKQLAQAQRPS
jgi:hypothetical protein